MLLLNIGTYPPRQCGIATFSSDFRDSQIINGNKVEILSLSNEGDTYKYPPEVKYNIVQNNRDDYEIAARLINSSDIDLVVIQHEYGIYGGNDGEYILDLAQRLEKPYIVIMHTVLPMPTKSQKRVLQLLGHGSAGVVSMTGRSGTLLADLYELPAETIRIIPHGVPEFVPQNSDVLKKKYGYSGHDVISTFGLIGPGKGLETAIYAMREVFASNPNALYLILGQTHPVLLKAEGEVYRHKLEQMVAELNLSKSIKFVNKFLTDEELGEYLYMTDVYLSPYPNKDQAVSGTMAFAIGCGRAIVSTAYAYAEEMLAGGRGLLVPPLDPEKISQQINRVLRDEALKLSLQNKAKQAGSDWSWPSVGSYYSDFFSSILSPSSELEKTYAR